MHKGVTLEDVSKSSSELGANWNIARVSNLENGRTTPTIQTLLTMVYALNNADKGESIRPLDLLEADPESIIQFGEIRLKGELFNQLVGGELYSLRFNDLVDGEEIFDEMISKAMGSLTKYGNNFKSGDARKARKEYSLADQRAAKKLGLSKSEFIGACLSLWGQLLSQKSEQEAGLESSAQKRGRTTRNLIKELEQFIAEGPFDGNN